MEASMVANKFTARTLHVVLRKALAPIYPLQPKFDNSIKTGFFDGSLKSKDATSSQPLKFALAIGFSSIIGIIGILIMLILGHIQ